ncbi:hypothetical protein IWW57_005365 [Coemansia sp. S610]|uniref:Uncharacterized protein n=2 Tax=Coemansia TaxID=4863 RepID=A0A9W8GLE7_9FUNG|nr:hypothetical protein IWW57_005365 [Coemansia sp. S610]KAJ2688762.1 hypothetical protein IWW39_001977 [Coemansia spiralis]KAJ2792801.1 hypothetical protein GGI18_000101 [Coemansia linderi]
MKLLVSLSVIVAVAASSIQAAVIPSAAPKPTLHIFGDSLSDIGTLRQLTLGIVPPFPYWQGRFSSGPVWNEYLSKLIGYDLYNKAAGGSTSDNSKTSLTDFLPIPMPIKIPSTQDQINFFKFTRPLYSLSPTRSLDIAVLEVGANDFFVHMFALATKTKTIGSFVETLSESVVSQLEQLRKIGFKNIVVTNLAAIQYTPMAALLKIQDISNATVSEYNRVFTSKAQAWATKNAKDLGFFNIADLAGFIELTVQSSAISTALGLTDVKTSCVGGNFLNLVQAEDKLLALLQLVVDAKDNVICSNPSTNYFFDPVHPAERVQRLFGYYGKEVFASLIQGTTYHLNEANILSLISKYNLGTPAPKPARV